MRIGSKNRKYALDLARAFGGAIIFSFPLFMTMEMWLLGFYIDAFRLALFLLLTMPLLVGLSYYAGFENTLSWRDDGLDALSAYAVGFAASAAMLFLKASSSWISRGGRSSVKSRCRPCRPASGQCWRVRSSVATAAATNSARTRPLTRRVVPDGRGRAVPGF